MDNLFFVSPLSDIQRRLDPDAVWLKMNSVGMVESVRSLAGKTTVETRYFISSLEQNVEQFANAVRSYWGIENSLHWILDVALKEDDCRIRKDNAVAVLPVGCVTLLHQSVTRTEEGDDRSSFRPHATQALRCAIVNSIIQN